MELAKATLSSQNQEGNRTAASNKDNARKNLSALYWRLLSQLQASLHNQQILDTFHQRVAEHFAIDGISYAATPEADLMLIGEQQPHQAAYRLRARNDDFGELTFFRHKRLMPEELADLELLLGTLISPLRNARQYQNAIKASRKDPLTSLGNRMAMTEQLEQEIAIANRHQRPLSLMMLDIDKFKSVNDQHGHQVGDLVLQQFSRLLEKLNRQSDQSYRFGGEEFVTILRDTAPKGALVAAERICSAISSHTLSPSQPELQVTTSIGLASYQPGDSTESLIRRADMAMYQIKNQGGNNFCCAESTHLIRSAGE